MNTRTIILASLSFITMNNVMGQDSTTINFSGYTELYYSFDFDKPATKEKPFFIYNHKRHNEVNLNLAYAKVNYAATKVRANVALMAGNYAQYNLAAEPELLRFVYEANIGVKLSQKHNLWLDAGIMPSHIGFESAVGADCWTASRSMLAENSPYFEAGVKLTSTNKKENFFVSVLLLNGWQRIQKPAGINKPSFGLQLNYKPKENITLNYSNFIGTDKPDTLHAVRTYHNLYAIYQINKAWGITAGFDIGSDKNASKQYAVWYSPVVIVRNSLNSKSYINLRAEYFNDKKQVLLQTNTINGFQNLGLSINYDYAVTKNTLVRIEGKGYFSKDKIYKEQKGNNNYAVLLVMSVRL